MSTIIVNSSADISPPLVVMHEVVVLSEHAPDGRTLELDDKGGLEKV